MEMENVALYGRISIDKQHVDTSIPNQLTDMRKLAELNHYNIVGEFTDVGKSAYDLTVDRDGFEKAMAMIESGAATKLIVWKLDRLTRNARGFMKINERLEAAGAKFQSVQEPWFDTSTPIGLALVMLMAALAQMEAEGIQARTIGFHAQRKARGDAPGGNRAYGYQRPAPNTLVIDPREAAIVIELAARVLAGDSLRGIARDLTDRGIPTARKKEWCHTTVRSVLLSPTIAGLVKITDDEYRVSPNWDPIIAAETWYAIRALLTDPNRIGHIGNDPDARKIKYLLPGLLKCGKCTNGKLVSKGHNRGRQYACDSCDLSIMSHVADTEVTNWVLANLTDEVWSPIRSAGKGNDPRVIARITERMEKLDDWFWSQDDNDTNRARYERQNANLNAELAAAQTAPAVKVPDVESIIDSWETMPLVDKRDVIRAAVPPITILPYAKGQTGTKRIKIGD